MTDLRPYQARAVEWATTRLGELQSEGRLRSVLIQLPTGGGKSRILRALACEAIIAPGTDLARQLRETTGARVYTIQDLAARRRRGEPLPLHRRWGLDEARWVAAPQWGSVVREIQASEGVETILVDATPSTADGRGLGEWASDLYQAASMRDLIRAGYLVPYRVLAPAEPQRDLAARPVDAWLSATPGETGIVFAENKRHAAQIAAEFEAEGVRAAVITDDTPQRERARLIKGLSDGEITIAVCAQILRQGIDVPRVSSIILARAIGSMSLYLQAVGRGSRPHEGKARCTVLDLRGGSHQHGLPEEDRVWSLHGPAVRLAGDALPPCVQCRACLSWGRGGACEVCGATLPPPPLPKVRAADLIEVRAQEGEEKKADALARYVGAAYESARSKGKTGPDAERSAWAGVYKFQSVYGGKVPSAVALKAIRAAREAYEGAPMLGLGLGLG